MSDTVEIAILNQKFHLKKGRAHESYIRMLAEYVDGKMREIQAKTQSVATSSVAILAALNIADEYLRTRDDYHLLEDRVREGVQGMIATIDAELSQLH